MGILDTFAGMSPEQNQGLLAAATQMLQASGPSLMPHSFGQVLGGGLGAYQQSMTAAQEAAQKKALMEQAAALNGFKLRDAESDFNNQEAARKRAQELAAVSGRYFGAGKSAQMIPGAQSAQGMGAGGDPATAAQPAAQPQAGAGNKTLYQQHLDYATFLRQQGYGPEADAQEAQALKFQPKVKGWEKVQQGGKVMFAPFYEDGTNGQPVPLEVAEKLEKVNRGGTTDLTNAYTGAVIASLKNTASPDAQLTAQTAGARLAFDRSQVGKPTFSAEAGGFAFPPSASNPTGRLVTPEGYTKPEKPLTESQGKASLFASRMDKANQTLEKLANGGTVNSGGIKRFAEGAGTVLGLGTESLGGTLSGMMGSATNWTQSKEQQMTEQAKRDFLSATLRMESGAVIGPKETAEADRQYFPQPNDDAATLALKAENRRTAIAGMALQAGPGAAKLGVGKRPAASNGWSITKVGD